MTRFKETLLMWLSSRRRGERLVHARLDALRGEEALSAADDAWLEQRLKTDPELRAYFEEQKALQEFLRPTPPIEAPTGFAARVVQAAEVRPRESLPELGGSLANDASDERWMPWVWATGAVAAVVVVAVMVQVPERPSPVSAGRLEVSGPTVAGATAPDFEVRAPGVGAARARSMIVSLARRHGGQPTEELTTQGRTDQGALLVRLPRSELVPIMRDLARSGTFKVTPLRSEPMPPDVQTVVLRFVLD